MADNSNTKLEVLDEELDDSPSDTKSDETQDEQLVNQKLENEKNPEDLNISNNFSGEQLNGLYDQMKKLPRGQLINLLANMKRQVTQKESEHDFTSVSDKKREDYKSSLQQKLAMMRMQRTGKKALDGQVDNLKKKPKKNKSAAKNDTIIDTKSVSDDVAKD